MKDNALENMANAGISLIKEHATLFSLESALAKQSIAPFFLSLAGLILLFISSWLALSVLGTYTLYLFTHNLLQSLIGITVFQIALLGMALFFTHRYQQRLKFKETRAHLKEYLGAEHE